MDRNNESFIGGKVLISLVTGVVLLIFVFIYLRKSSKKARNQRHPCIEVKFGNIFTEAYIAPVGSITYCKKSIATKAGYRVQTHKAIGKLGPSQFIEFIGKTSVEISISGRRIVSDIYVVDDQDYLPLVLAGDVLRQFQAVKIQEKEKKVHFGNIIVPFIYKDPRKGNVFSVLDEVANGK